MALYPLFLAALIGLACFTSDAAGQEYWKQASETNLWAGSLRIDRYLHRFIHARDTETHRTDRTPRGCGRALGFCATR